jgi:hypothetical protein
MWSYGKLRSYEERSAKGKEPQKPIDMDDYEDALRDAAEARAHLEEVHKYTNGGGYHPEDDCKSCQRRKDMEKNDRRVGYSVFTEQNGLTQITFRVDLNDEIPENLKPLMDLVGLGDTLDEVKSDGARVQHDQAISKQHDQAISNRGVLPTPGCILFHKSNPKIHWCVKVVGEVWCDVECVSVLTDGSVVVYERSFPHKSLVCVEQDNLSED